MQRKIGLWMIILCLIGIVMIQQPGNAAGSGEPLIRVSLSYPFTAGNPETLSFRIQGTYQLNGVSLVSGNTYRIEKDGNGGLVFKRSDGSRIIGGSLFTLVPSNRTSDYIELFVGNGYSYREGMEFSLSGNAIQSINILGLENYLQGVVPAEMVSTWGKEALKSQAVAARSYVMEALNRLGWSTTVKDTTAFQVYHGMKDEKPSTTLAVNETRGVMLNYGGRVISTLFSSSNGGVSESNNNVWNGEGLAYYTSRPDPYDAKVPNYKNWSANYTSSQIQQMLQQWGVNIGQIKDLQILTTFASGRIQDLAIIGTQGSFHVGKNNARAYFSLQSALYEVSNSQKVNVLNGSGSKQEGIIQGNYVVSSTATKQGSGEMVIMGANGTKTVPASPSFIFTGSGNGHGVGMSQYGAMEMANEGKTFNEILAFYYPNTSLATLY